MKNKKESKDKNRKYSPPKIYKHDIKKLTSNWHYGMYGAAVAAPDPCTCT